MIFEQLTVDNIIFLKNLIIFFFFFKLFAIYNRYAIYYYVLLSYLPILGIVRENKNISQTRLT